MFVFHHIKKEYLHGQEVTETKLLVRDVIIADLKEWGKANKDWTATESLLTKFEY